MEKMSLSSPENQGQHESEKNDSKQKKLIEILLNGNAVSLEQGKYIVSTLKQQLGVPPDYELDIVHDGEFKPLADSDELSVHKNLELISHVRHGGSS